MKPEELYSIYLKHRSVSTDTRKISPSCIFFALKGENFDANQFAVKALEAGAAYAVIDNPEYAVDERYILVDDVLSSLQSLAAHHRKQLTIPVIGITGTNGKTTTKELIRAVLSQHYTTYATEGNLNNHIGVPLTLLSVDDNCEMAIIEMGANHQKEIEFLCSIAQPEYGLITNVGKAHLEGFGGVSGVRIAKGELYEHLSRTGGTAFINRDNPILVEMARERNLEKLIGYGAGIDNYTSGSLKEVSPALVVAWQSEGQEDKKLYTAESNLPGTYNFENILAAICLGNFFGMSADGINEGIRSYIPRNNRSQLQDTGKNMVICDYYNANPSSMAVALDNLQSLPAENKAMILGDMFELGTDSPIEHRLIYEKGMATGAVRRIFVGEEFFRFEKAEGAEFYRTTLEAAEALKREPLTGMTVLLKGSRGMKLEALLGNL